MRSFKKGLQIIYFSLCKSLLVNVNKPWLHTWGRAQAYTSERPLVSSLKPKLCRVLWPCPCTYLPPTHSPPLPRPLPPPGGVIWQMCAARRLSDPPKNQTDAFIYYSRRRSNSWRGGKVPSIFVYICVGKSEFSGYGGGNGGKQL